ncbi:MFS transporter [Haloarchaeobius sp. HRN-SO-5]|uniref:MFS transporter n=1 Tax=Haloarchaeobius sp. HRN-SO-5 TaxID=3446118 RepID=UPI003EB874E0
MTESRHVVWRYYLFRATNSAGFYVAIAIAYLEYMEFGYDFIGLAYAVFSFGMVAAEIPTGYLGDWLGRRWSLALGAVCRALTLGAYPLVDSQAAVLWLHLLWAVGWAFRSGTIDAWLYEVLADRFDESEYARIEGRGSTLLLGTSAVTAILGGLLYGVDPAYPFLANAALALLGIPLLFTFPTVASERDDCETDECEAFTVRDATSLLHVQARRPAVRWFVLYVALFGGLFGLTRTFEQPALNAIGFPVTGFGFLYAAFKVVSAGAAAAAGWLDDALGIRAVFALMVPVYAVAFTTVAFVPAMVVPALFLNRSLNVLTRPIRNQYLNDRLDDVGRATVLSGVSMVVGLASGSAKLVGGWGATHVGPVGILPWAGVVVPAVAALLWVATAPVRAPERPGAGDAVPSD